MGYFFHFSRLYPAQCIELYIGQYTKISFLNFKSDLHCQKRPALPRQVKGIIFIVCNCLEHSIFISLPPVPKTRIDMLFELVVKMLVLQQILRKVGNQNFQETSKFQSEAKQCKISKKPDQEFSESRNRNKKI